MPMFGSTANAFRFPCPAPLSQFYCRNGGQCFARYDDDQREEAEKATEKHTYSNSYLHHQATNGKFASSSADNSLFENSFASSRAPVRRLTPFCQCAPNYHGQRCEYFFDADIYGFQFADNDEELLLHRQRIHGTGPDRHHITDNLLGIGVDQQRQQQVDYESFVGLVLASLLFFALFAFLCCILYFRRRRQQRQKTKLENQKGVETGDATVPAPSQRHNGLALAHTSLPAAPPEKIITRF